MAEEKLQMHSPNLVQGNIKKIAELFPNTLTEVEDENGNVKQAIDFDILKQELADYIVSGKEERYQFTWPEKRNAILLANSPISETLRPCREESVGKDGTPGGFDSENLYIEGDNLDVLKLLQETYLGKIKMIYIDPPYNTGEDFIYDDDFIDDLDDYLEKSGQYDSKGNKLVENPETNGRFHTDWINMIYPRLKIARNLLTEDGVIFISIDEGEQANVIKICDEIFGSSNFVDCITWNKRIPKNDNKGIGNIHEYIIVYRKSNTQRQFLMPKDGIDEIFEFIDGLKKKGVPIPEAEQQLKQLYNKKGYDRGITLYCNLDDNYEPWGKINVSWPNGETFGPRYDVLHPITKKPTKVPDRGWRWSKDSFNEKLDYEHTKKRYDGSYVCGDIWFANDENTQPSSIKYLKDVSKMLLRSIISLKSDGGMEVEKIFDGKSYFSYPKPVTLLKTLIGSLEEKDGIFLDFFSGSATTANAIMELNSEDSGTRKFIMVQLPELTKEKSEAYKAGYSNLCEIGKERIRRVAKNIKAQNLLNITDQDFGFRVLKLDSTNMKDIYYNPAEITQASLDGMIDNIKSDRTQEDLLFQVMIDLGVPLSSKIEETSIAGKKIYNVADNFLAACFDSDVTEEVITAIAKTQPYFFVMRDSSAAGDSVIANFEQIFKTYSPDTKRKVL